jgi:hypothetical protein
MNSLPDRTSILVQALYIHCAPGIVLSDLFHPAWCQRYKYQVLVCPIPVYRADTTLLETDNGYQQVHTLVARDDSLAEGF